MLRVSGVKTISNVTVLRIRYVNPGSRILIFNPSRIPDLKTATTKFVVVSPAYGYIALALVKCSNEGGPGPRYNMKEDPGSSIFSMLVVHGYHLYLMPLFSEAGDWKTSVDPLPPPQTNLG